MFDHEDGRGVDRRFVARYRLHVIAFVRIADGDNTVVGCGHLGIGQEGRRRALLRLGDLDFGLGSPDVDLGLSHVGLGHELVRFPRSAGGFGGDLRGHHVLVLDDILDSGGTLHMVVPALREMGAASVKSCVLLRKDRPAVHAVHVDYVGFEIPDTFVVGYGLDYNDYYRNLPDIVTLKDQIHTA